MEFKISGDNLQLVTIQLNPEEKIYAESGSMVYMSGNMNMEAKMRGGLMKGIGRKFTGETAFLTEFNSIGGQGMVSFGGRTPGTIKDLDITPGNDFFAQKDAFLVAQDSIEMSVAFQKRLGSALFGGEGFIIQKYSGNGKMWIHASGDFVEFNLEPNQILKVDTGSVVGWDSTVSYEIERVKGVKTMFFGGEGIFITKLVGPGKVILQSLNVRELAQALLPYIPRNTS